ncbi:hypothetical protein Fbal_3045 [Ferrimonas balearica DSM 9799]|uniref:Uncharacterized protein n=1 Tax=Ferrimonas balearica (strain DSM 9799 / CCM 4581 / KCTC 23876 / PAT) TaxID=550540 RepID=E1SU01_FERBD|nr:hypothetical protein [Ferrimonas balearica]ADN77245.1 hypothetical protein Fbal_3045 [Ferrimonas balearica DSM 9799]MBW3139761.1 hypothetical protein [Ferrimonas balearica]MBW3164785.1 hypothetical protein [Ferrimonas balearica]MBY5980351.1 hypothetical protein [Ferrimonas balearica]MBY6107133.1 hypothetical protein [Ferrimonas balearica]
MRQPLCQQCRNLLSNQDDQPHEQLQEFAHHEASTVDGGFSEHEFRCNNCGHVLRHMSGIIMDSGWSEIPEPRT